MRWKVVSQPLGENETLKVSIVPFMCSCRLLVTYNVRWEYVKVFVQDIDQPLRFVVQLSSYS